MDRQFGFNNIQQQQPQMTTTGIDRITSLKNSIDHKIEDKGIKDIYINKKIPLM